MISEQSTHRQTINGRSETMNITNEMIRAFKVEQANLDLFLAVASKAQGDCIPPIDAMGDDVDRAFQAVRFWAGHSEAIQEMRDEITDTEAQRIAAWHAIRTVTLRFDPELGAIDMTDTHRAVYRILHSTFGANITAPSVMAFASLMEAYLAFANTHAIPFDAFTARIAAAIVLDVDPADHEGAMQ